MVALLVCCQASLTAVKAQYLLISCFYLLQAVAVILQVLEAQVVPAVAPVQGPAAVVVAVLVPAVPGPVAQAQHRLGRVRILYSNNLD